MFRKTKAPNGGEAFGASISTRGSADQKNYNPDQSAFTAASHWADAVDYDLKPSVYKNLLKMIWIAFSAKWGGREYV